MTAYSVSVTAAHVTVVAKPVVIVEHLSTKLWNKIRFWRGLRRGSVLPAVIE